MELIPDRGSDDLVMCADCGLPEDQCAIDPLPGKVADMMLTVACEAANRNEPLSFQDLARAVLARRDLITPTRDVLALADQWEKSEQAALHATGVPYEPDVTPAAIDELRSITRGGTS